MQYKDVSFDDPAYDNGASATVGIQQDAGIGQQYSHNQAVLQDQMAIQWVKKAPQNTIEYEAIDTEPYNWADISATGTLLSINVLYPTYAHLQIPFPINFYDQQYNALTVAASGSIHFEG